jgi:hypothetical protein
MYAIPTFAFDVFRYYSFPIYIDIVFQQNVVYACIIDRQTVVYVLIDGHLHTQRIDNDTRVLMIGLATV